MRTFILLHLIFLFGSTALSQTPEGSVAVEEILDSAEVEPSFPGGEYAMILFIQNNFVYPEYSKEMGEQGTVYVSFVVNRDGSISDIEILKGVSKTLDEEVMRVISVMPSWTPGMQAGKLVRVRYCVPVKCTIESGRKNKKKKR